MSNHTQSSTSSRPKARSVRSKAIIDLGTKLVSELGDDVSGDTLSLWMANYIAELMHNVESCQDSERGEACRRCESAILELWDHRDSMVRRPFLGYQKVLQTLQSLEPGRSLPRYFQKTREAAAEDELEDSAETWLELASSVDVAARILISHCLAQAASREDEEPREWIKLASEAGVDGDDDLHITRILLDEMDLLSGTVDDVKRGELENRLGRLKAFGELAALLSSDLSEQIEACKKLPESDTSDPSYR